MKQFMNSNVFFKVFKTGLFKLPLHYTATEIVSMPTPNPKKKCFADCEFEKVMN